MRDVAGEGKLDRMRIPFNRGSFTLEVVVARCNRGRMQGYAGKSSFNRGEIHIDKEEVVVNATQSSALQSYRRVREFLNAHQPADMPAGFAAPVAELDVVLTELTRSAQQQNTSIRAGLSEVRRQRALRDELWSNHMLPLSRLAREIFGVPGVDAALRLPKRSADNDRVLAAAHGMANAAEKERDTFVRHGLPETFVTALRAAATALEQALGARVESRRERVKATAAVAEQVKRGKRAVRMINALIAPKLAMAPELLAAWKDAKRWKSIRAGGATLPPVDPDIVKVA